MNSED
jgi:hypothetical protein